MEILVDANVLIDYAEGAQYAVSFFNKAMRENYEIKVVTAVYEEARLMSDSFNKIETLISMLRKYSIYEKIIPTEQERTAAKKMFQECARAGRALDFADVLQIVIAKQTSWMLFTRDREMKETALKKGVKLFS
ncbi:MAG: PIN domain-containing protein [Candidatus Micrarchaeota archaeon]